MIPAIVTVPANVTLEHKPGKSNVAADAFSQVPVGKAMPQERNEPQQSYT